jgi:predicted ATPase
VLAVVRGVDRTLPIISLLVKRRRNGFGFSLPEDALASIQNYGHATMDGVERLQFAALRLCGRGRELTTLMDCFERSANPVKPMPNYVLVEGPTGCGKTALVDAFCTKVAGKALIGRGKFQEPLAAPEPFSTIVNAVDGALAALAKSDDRSLWKKRLMSALGPGNAFLQEHVPSLRVIMQDGERQLSGRSLTEERTHSDGFLCYEKDWGFERLRLGFKLLMRAICKYETTVIAVDDLQWADRDSLEVLRTILADSAPHRRLFFIAMNRTTQIHQQPHRLFEALREKRSIRLRLANLHSDSITEIVAELLKRPRDHVKPVVKVLLQKTNGEPFSVLQLLRRMEYESFLLYTPFLGWEWDTEVLKLMRSSHENMSMLLADKLRGLDSSKQEVLVSAAFIGSSTFRAECIVQANSDRVDGARGHDQALSTTAVRERTKLMESVLRSLVEEGLVNEPTYGDFVLHDRVREVAYSLIPSGKARIENHLRIGRNLNLLLQDIREAQGGTESFYLFKAVNQLNRGAELISDRWERLDLVEMNYQAAEQAMTKCSYSRALSHVDQGIRLLGRDPWKTHTELTKKLTIARCRLLYCCGLCEDAERAADIVISRTHSFSDQRIVFNTKIRCLLERGQQKNALQVCLSVLTDIGIQMPKRALKGHIAKSIVKLKRLFRGRDEKRILNTPPAADDALKDTSYFVSLLGEVAEEPERDDYTTLARLRILQMTLEHGCLPLSSISFVSWGIVLAQMGEFDEAILYGNIGIQMANENAEDRYNAYARMLFYSNLALWKFPLKDCMEPIADELAVMYGAGALEMVHEKTSCFLQLSFVGLKPLAEVSDTMWEYACLLRDYQQWHAYSVNVSFFQMVSNLLGASSENPTTLTGDYMDEIAQMTEWRRTENTAALQMFTYCSTLLSFLFGDMHLAEESCSRLGTTIEEGPQVWFPLVVFLRGLVNLAVSGSNMSRKHRRQGDAAAKQMEGWSNAGCVNLKHMFLILKAEQMSLDDVHPDAVKTAWDTAIDSAKGSGFLFHQALAYELAGVYFRNTDQNYHAKSYLSRARATYREWGCDSKIALMHSRYSDTLEAVSDALSVSSGRSYEKATFRRSGML